MIITFSEQYGSSGYWIAKGLAERLGYQFCNDEIVTAAMKGNGSSQEEETFRYFNTLIDDKITEVGLDAQNLVPEFSASGEGLRNVDDIMPLSKHINSMVRSLALDVSPLNWEMDEAQRQVLNELADQDNCVFMGKCASFYLQDRTNRLSIFTMDDLPVRVERIAKHFNVDPKAAEETIRKTDIRRDNYHRYFTGTGVGDMDILDMKIRVSKYSIEYWIDLFESMVREMEKEMRA